MTSLQSFTALGVDDAVAAPLAAAGIISPTGVQTRVIPAIASGAHVIFQSETGTGKTLAYLLPLLTLMTAQNADGANDNRVYLIVAAPTFELASQIKTEAQKLTDAGVSLCIGSAPIKRQLEMLALKPRVVVGNPARLCELIALGKLKTAGVRALVLDEADRLFSPELSEYTRTLVSLLPPAVQVIANSATIRDKTQRDIESLIPSSPVETIRLPPEDILTRHIEHQALYSEKRDKIDTLRSYLAAVKPAKALVFTARTSDTDVIASRLRAKKVDCGFLHAKMDKKERKAALDRFRSGKLSLLVTSDLAARGLDIPNITHIIQLDLPLDDDFFIHRSGRTGRANKSGINIVIGDEYELRRYAQLEKKLGLCVQPQTLFGGNLSPPPSHAVR
jgi:superfamily II DNA/RNA helicase